MENIHANHRKRVRYKVMLHSSDILYDHELLELMLFYSIPRKDTNPIAHRLISHFGSFEKIFNASVKELSLVEGVGENTAVLIKTIFDIHTRLNRKSGADIVFDTYEQIGTYLMKQFFGTSTERLILLLLDKKGHIDRTITVSEGNSELASVNIKKIISNAISDSAVSAVLAHNHPSGLLCPSYEDKHLTMQAEDLLRSLGIRLIDHYIITSEGFVGVKQKFTVNTTSGMFEDTFDEKNL